MDSETHPDILAASSVETHFTSLLSLPVQNVREAALAPGLPLPEVFWVVSPQPGEGGENQSIPL
jgi:hypothetical protein